MPTASALQYATECFEGIKLYRGFDGRLRLFRVQLNCLRMVMSAQRVALPSFDPAELEKLVKILCKAEGRRWLPASKAGHCLYVRPTMIGTGSALGPQKPKEALLYIVIAPFPAASKAAPPMKLLSSSEHMVRAWPGGYGYAKIGANYGPTLAAVAEARESGYDQVLWLMGPEAFVTETSGSNFFIVWKTREGTMQLITAPLGSKYAEKLILDGVTRKSVVQIAKERLATKCKVGTFELDALEIVEKNYTMFEIAEAASEGRVVEAFTCGTAYFLAPVSCIHFDGKDIDVSSACGTTGPYASVIQGWLSDIMFGRVDHPWAILVEENDSEAAVLKGSARPCTIL